MLVITPFTVQDSRPPVISPGQPGGAGIDIEECGAPQTPPAPAEPVELFRQQVLCGPPARLPEDFQLQSAVRCRATSQSGVSIEVARGQKDLAYQAVLPAGRGLLSVPVVIEFCQRQDESSVVRARTVEPEPRSLHVVGREGSEVKVCFPGTRTDILFRQDTLEYGLASADQVIEKREDLTTLLRPLTEVVRADGSRRLEVNYDNTFHEYADANHKHESRVAIDLSKPARAEIAGESVYHGSVSDSNHYWRPLSCTVAENGTIGVGPPDREQALRDWPRRIGECLRNHSFRAWERQDFVATVHPFAQFSDAQLFGK